MTNESQFMEPLLLAGRIIMENGGETYRVEETINRMGRAFGLSGVESFAVPSGLFISYKKENGEAETRVLRIRKGSTNLTRVNEVNSISRAVEARELNCEEALARLKAVQTIGGTVKKRWLPVAAAVSAGGFAVMFGGGPLDFALAVAVTALVQTISVVMDSMHMESMVTTLLSSLLSTLIPLVLHALTGLGLTEAIIAGALMPMLPGLAMTNAVQDTMRGDLISGMAHGIQAVLTAGLVAGGALLATTLFYLTMGGAA